MGLAVMLQFGATLVLAVLAWVAGGQVAGVSALLGGLCAAIPNGLFAARLAMNTGRAPESYPVVFFVGEFVKVAFTAMLFGAVIAWSGEKHWLALLVGFIVVLKMPLFALWFAKSEPDVNNVSGELKADPVE